MTQPIVDPLVAMAAAAEQIRTGMIEEVEMDWHFETSDHEVHLTLTVRRYGRQLVLKTGDDDRD